MSAHRPTHTVQLTYTILLTPLSHLMTNTTTHIGQLTQASATTLSYSPPPSQPITNLTTHNFQHTLPISENLFTTVLYYSTHIPHHSSALISLLTNLTLTPITTHN